MEKAISLNGLALGQSAQIKELDFSGGDRRRMQDLGFREGNVVRAVLKSPSNNPTAYQVCGAVIALRESDSRRIRVLPLQRDGGAF